MELLRKPLVLPAHVAVGVAKGFLIYAIPACLYNRSISPNIRSSFSVGFFVGSYRFMESYLNHISKLEKDEGFITKYKEAIAAAISTYILLRTDGSWSNWTVMFSYLLLKALKYQIPDRFCHPLAPVASLCISSSQIISTYIKAPEDMSERIKNSLTKRLEREGSSLNIANNIDSCKFMHGSSSCSHQAINLFVGDFRRGIRLYGMFALIRVLRGMQKKQLNVPDVLQRWLRSAFYYGTFTTLALISSCTANRLAPGTLSRLRLFCHCWIAGLALLIESPDSRADQAVYMGAYALDSFYTTWKRKNFALLSRHPLLRARLSVCLWMFTIAILVKNKAFGLPKLL